LQEAHHRQGPQGHGLAVARHLLCLQGNHLIVFEKRSVYAILKLKSQNKLMLQG
jgi:hypothetical protein